MESVSERLPQIEEKIMSGLKDFQRATVNRIDELYRAGQMRILVSDEVGLGKTLIARGTVAKLARMRKEQGDNLVKVVYICSNAAIADQNLNKLRISRDVRKENVSYSRLSMQHLNIYFQENDPKLLKSYIQLIPLTPDTSFRMTSGAGTVEERALMFALLRRMPGLKEHEKALETAMKDCASAAWGNWAKGCYEKLVRECDEYSSGRYIKEMLDSLDSEFEREIDPKNSPGVKLRTLVINMCRVIEKNGYKRQGNNYTIGKLRIAFARISLEKLDPDLVIMDEFQRFKYLISADPESETGMLANKFFNTESVRMLLLSATPYKMYSTMEEIDETQVDEHYAEFLNVMRFLNVTEEADNKFRSVWTGYSVQLKELSKGAATVLSAKKAAEDAMYSHICRTERISAKENADIIDDADVKLPLRVLEQDIQSYLQAQKLLDEIGAPFNVPVDYIKSTPYLMSFMRDYQLKRHVEKYFHDHPDELPKIRKSTLWLDRRSLDKYAKIPNGNARLDRVMNHVFTGKAEQLLWVPPSKPYYAPAGVYKNTDGFSKTLIFSSWEMVPRMAASMISYNAERLTVGKLAADDRTAHYFNTGKKRYPAARMNFNVSQGRPGSMTLFCLLYPSLFLSKCYDPIGCLNQGMSLTEIERSVRKAIEEKLSKCAAPDNGQPDRRWYYLAPLFMDGAGYVSNWLNSEDKLAAYDDDYDEESGNENKNGNKNQKMFLTHIRALRELYYEMGCGTKINLGKKPDDLTDVLVDMAIASPAVCINRTYEKYLGTNRDFESYLPSQIARLFINRMNSVESTAAVELACGKKSDDAHWQNVLTYCKQGNLQSMFDEYAHLLSTGLDDDEDLIHKLHAEIAGSMDFRTTVYNIDTYEAFAARMTGEKKTETEEDKRKTCPIRSHFAVAFTKGDSKEKDTDRKKAVRNAFNSPFRPFVLASTSIGQEGLDFHNYCRRIVHWNLPSNPIDLEQREGRINRFECLAIRQNIAKRYGSTEFKKDVWKEMFEQALQSEKTEGCSDLIPYWGLRDSGDMIKIERIVPMYPFSRDEQAYERLIRILSLYRLTLGQARQEELLEYIFQNCEDPEKMKKMFINLSPFYRAGSEGEERYGIRH